MAQGGGRTETLSVLFTDVVGSTQLRERLGEEQADVARRAHDAILEAAVTACDGRVVKHLGDGLMATFDAAADAVAAAVEMQRQLQRHRREHPEAPLSIRVGISVGDVTIEDDDCFGTAVVEASRLCDVAIGDQIVVADLVRALTRGRGGHTFESFGELELRGLSAPVEASVVAWRAAATDAGPIPFPPLLAPPSATGYAGRPDLLEELTLAWKDVVAGTSRTVLLVGEPGIGKTRTASELATVAHEAGAVVLYGRCDEELLLSYGPFVEALEWQTAHDPDAGLGRFPGDLRRLVPDLDARVPGLPAAIESDARTEEHRLFQAVASWLATASSEHGMVLVVDDLHWATRPTLQLLLHVARSVASDPESRLLVMATYRDTDVDRSHPLSSVLADLRRLPGVSRLPVAPLTEDEVLDFIAQVAGHDLDEDVLALARRAYAETEGNPFFVGEVLRHLIETGVVAHRDGRWKVVESDRIDVPEGVRDVIGRRLDRLSEDANEVLTVAAVVGRDFRLDVVARVSRRDEDAVLDALDEAIAARLVEEVGTDRFRFVHALTRQALEEEPSATRRRRLHRRIAQALADLHPQDVAGCARHSLEAGDDPAHACACCVAAGGQALAGRAVADAIEWFDRALELEDDLDDPGEVVLRARVGRGVALRDLGEPGHRDLLLAVTRDALAAGAIPIAVEATLANSRVINSIVGAVDQERLDNLRAVLAVVPDDLPERAVLQAALATELTYAGGPPEERLAIADEAVELAESIGDPGLVARVRTTCGNAVNVPQRLAVLDEWVDRGVETADRAGDPTSRALARLQRAYQHLSSGRLAASRAGVEEMVGIAQAEGSPTLQWITGYFAIQHLAWDGDLAAAHARNAELLELGQQIGEPDALNWWAGMALGLAWAEGTMGQFVDLYRTAAEQYPVFAGWKISLASALLRRGDRAAAEALVDEHGLDRRDAVNRDFFTLGIWSNQADVLLRLGRLDALAELGEEVEPYVDYWGTVGVWTYLPTTIALAHARLGQRRPHEALELAAATWEAVVACPNRALVPIAADYVVRCLLEVGSDRARALSAEVLAVARPAAQRLAVPELGAELAGHAAALGLSG